MNFLFFETLLLLPRAADCARRCPAETRAQVLARPVNALLFLSIFFSFCYSNNNNIICCCYIDSISSFILSADCCNSSSSSSRVYRGVAILLLAGRGHRNGEWHGEPTPLGPVWIVLDLRDIHTTKVDGLLYTVETDDSVECPLYKCTAGHTTVRQQSIASCWSYGVCIVYNIKGRRRRKIQLEAPAFDDEQKKTKEKKKKREMVCWTMLDAQANYL